MRFRTTVGLAMLVSGAAVLSLPGVATAQGAEADAPNLDVAEYAPDSRLALPKDTDRWIAVGSGIGGNYSEAAFDPANPGLIGVVQMEPAAYDFFLENRRYADGTMFLLTFYAVQKKPEPALQGFVQGNVVQREIHVIDRERFPEESRAFFVFPSTTTDPGARMPLGSACFQCHTEHAALDATFVQFYPALRELED